LTQIEKNIKGGPKELFKTKVYKNIKGGNKKIWTTPGFSSRGKILKGGPT
jgi:hypothetical protein